MTVKIYELNTTVGKRYGLANAKSGDVLNNALAKCKTPARARRFAEKMQYKITEQDKTPRQTILGGVFYCVNLQPQAPKRHQYSTWVRICFYLVDVNGLEPLTLRTSSECSTS